MSVTRTFTVTVVSTGSGNKYFIDGVQQDTVTIAEGFTYRFDQSDSSNGSHPLRFSTTSDGTHNSGSEYTTGVTTNGTPGSDGAYTQIEVAASAPTLYYYCSNHPGMGGQANTPAGDTWGVGTWSTNSWNAQNGINVDVTGVSATTSVGTLESFNVEGWSRQEYGNSAWGVEYSVEPTGFSLTASLGTAAAEQFLDVEVTGLSMTSSVGAISPADAIAISGFSLTASLGALTSVGTLVGWGRNGWNEEPYGDSINKVIVPVIGDQMATNVGSISPADVMGLTGVSATSSIGSPTIIGDITVSLTGVSATSSLGTIVTIEGIGLTGVSATSSVGALAPADVMGLTGISATITLGEVATSQNPIIEPSGLPMTLSVGSLSPVDVMGLTGVSSTSSVGSLAPVDVMGLTGQSATASVAGFGTASGFGIQAYQAIDTGSNTSYTDVA